jgi:hypothetical protein
MTRPRETRAEEDVLEAFAMEAEHDRATLERYLRDYPEHASAVCELSFELNRTDLEERELDDSDELLVGRAWSDRVAASVEVVNPLHALKPAEKRRLADTLNIRLQVLSLFREGRIIIETVPNYILAVIAGFVGSGLDEVKQGLRVRGMAAARSYKSDRRPEPEQQVSFERALRDSGASDDEIAELMRDR